MAKRDRVSDKSITPSQRFLKKLRMRKIKTGQVLSLLDPFLQLRQLFCLTMPSGIVLTCVTYVNVKCHVFSTIFVDI